MGTLRLRLTTPIPSNYVSRPPFLDAVISMLHNVLEIRLSRYAALV